MKRSDPYFSIIIPAKNEDKLIEQCLKSISIQHTNKSFEVILVDGGSYDATISIAKKYKTTVVIQNSPGKVNGIQTGIMKAKGKIICITEADCIIPENWLSVIDAHFNKYPKTIAVTGFYTFFDGTMLENILLSIFWRFGVYGYRIIFGNHGLRNSNCAIRREALMKLNGMDTQFAEFYDLDLSIRMRLLGKISFIPAMNIQTSCRRIKGRILRFLSEYIRGVYAVGFQRKGVKIEIYEHIR